MFYFFLLPRFLLLRSMLWSEPFLHVLCCGIFLGLNIFPSNNIVVGMHTLPALWTPCVYLFVVRIVGFILHRSIVFFQPANLYSYGLRRAQTHLVSFTSLRYLSLWIRWTSNLFVCPKPSSYANVSPQFCWMDMRVRVSSLQLFSCRRCTWFCMMWIAASTTAVGFFCFLKRGAFTRAACNDQTWGSYNVWYPYCNLT